MFEIRCIIRLILFFRSVIIDFSSAILGLSFYSVSERAFSSILDFKNLVGLSNVIFKNMNLKSRDFESQWRFRLRQESLMLVICQMKHADV